MFNSVSLKTPDEAFALSVPTHQCEASAVKYFVLLFYHPATNVKAIPVLFDLQIEPKQKWKTPHPTRAQPKMKTQVLRGPGLINVKN